MSASLRRKLSMKEMFLPPYIDTSLRELSETFDLEIQPHPYYTPNQLRNHYDLEVELAMQLKSASKAERKKLYGALYEKLFKGVPYHPQLKKKSDKRDLTQLVDFLRRFVSPKTVFLELGAGDCQLSFAIAQIAKMVYAIEVSETISYSSSMPNNFQLILSDGCSIDVPASSINVAFSNHLMEHIHPDDAREQLVGIHRALVDGGVYLCITPHRFGGPSDISRYFDKVAKGLHLKEYTLSDLKHEFKGSGFSKVYLPRRIKGLDIKFPVGPTILLEHVIDRLPHFRRKRVFLFLRKFFDLRVVAQK
jgi:SAM-dependent methyltransferase